jgi:hypothetical protein
MSEFRDTGEVRARLSGLFKPELGFIKSANLAGEMVTRHWAESRGDNYEQALSILAASRHALFSPVITDELLVYLAGHQMAHQKIRFFSPSVKTSRDDRLAAADWFNQKATDFAQKTGQTQFFNNEVWFQIRRAESKYYDWR